MKLYLLTQSEVKGYDTYDSLVVAALDARAARNIHPYGKDGWYDGEGYWTASPKQVTSKLIGTAKRGTPQGVILSSFCAG